MPVVLNKTKDLSDAFIAQCLEPYGITCDPRLAGQIRSYITVLLQWNRKVSLTTVTDATEILKFHFGESLFAVSAVPIRSRRLADIGSGAGFPGLPIRMALPDLDLTLVEPNARKATFLSEVARLLHLDRVTVFRGRMQDLPAGAPPFDFITARALGRHEQLFAWSERRLADGGRLVLWLGEEDAKGISKTPGWSWRAPVHIPGSKKRVLLVGSPA